MLEPAPQSNKGEEQSPASTDHKRTSMLKIVGRVLSERHVANMKREILLLADGVECSATSSDTDTAPTHNSTDKMSQAKEYRVRLHAKENEGVSMWMSIKKARQLICQGVQIQVEGWLESKSAVESDETTSNDTIDDGPDKPTTCDKEQIQFVVAGSIQVVSALPTKTYLATLLSFPLEDLQKLFPKDGDSGPQSTIKGDLAMTKNSLSLPPGVLVACCTSTISPSYLEAVASFCRLEKSAGRADKLWNAPKVKGLVQSLRDHHEAHGSLALCLDNDSKKHGQLPRTSKRTWKSLARLEDKWLRLKRDGEIGDYDYDMPTHSYRTKRKHDGSEHEVAQQSLASSIRSEQIVLSSSTASSESMVEHVRNLPNPQDERRLWYIDQRKRPQVRCMLDFIKQLLQKIEDATDNESTNNGGTKSSGDKTIKGNESDDSHQNLHLVEIGGGRGYLAHEVAAFYKTQQKMLTKIAPRFHVHVTVIDNNERSLRAGQVQAEQAGLTDCMSFVLCDLNDGQQVETSITSPKAIDLVFGLHCCGGLAEAAVELAVKNRVSFCISTCCFRSIPSLASLTELAVGIWAREQAKEDKRGSIPPTSAEKEKDGQLQCQLFQQHKQQINEDLARVASLAVNVGAKGQHRAIRLCNAMRLSAAETRFAERATTGSIRVWQDAFPVEYSVQNRVLMGLIT